MEVLRNWVLRLKFVQDAFVKERDEQIAKERPTIFALAQKDILETMTDDIDKQAEALAQEKLKKLLFLEDMRDILEIKNGKVLLNGKETDQTQIANLKAEADFFQASELWRLLNNNLRADAETTMFALGNDVQRQLETGRTILYTLDVQDKTIQRLQKLSTPVQSINNLT